MKKYRERNKTKLSEQNQIKTQERRKRNKQKAVDYLGGKCLHCATAYENNSVYDFHHVDTTTKEADPGSLLHYSWKRIVKELDKCILLCANCHRIEHNKENNV